ncbi:MAG: hypothetical protein ACRELY_32710 [Polyangiaceae bacterium]
METQAPPTSSALARAHPAGVSPLRADAIELDASVVGFDISSSETAQIFHISDQMSEWSPFMHRQYLRWAVEKNLLGDRQRRALDAHRALRQKLRYGKLDELFYTTQSVQDALARAQTVLSPDDVATERALFDAMTPVVLPLIESKKKETDELRAQVMGDGPRLAKMLNDLVFFTETTVPKQHVPLWLVASPDKHYGGGGYNAGQMVLEAANGASDTLLHESLHFVLNRRMNDLKVEADECGNDLDSQTLSEGIAYALYPGIVGRPGVLDETIAHLAAENRDVNFPYVRFNRLGRALVPLLDAALRDKTTLTQMLPAACEAWKKVNAEPWPPEGASQSTL